MTTKKDTPKKRRRVVRKSPPEAFYPHFALGGFIIGGAITTLIFSL